MGPNARFVIGSLEGVEPCYWSPLNVEKRLPQILALRGARVVLTGVEPLGHPALPAIVLAQQGLEVWIETLAQGLQRPAPAEILASRGLRGVRWLHLPATATPYRSLIHGPPSNESIKRTWLTLLKASLAVEHVLVIGALRGRLEALRRQPFARHATRALRLSTAPLGEKWSARLGLAPLSADAADAIAAALSGLAQPEHRDAWRTIVPGPE